MLSAEEAVTVSDELVAGRRGEILRLPADMPRWMAGTIVLVVGPEGGLTPHEREALRAAGARTVRLGPSVLRSSSAGMAAAAVVLASTTRWAAPPDGDA